MVSSKSFIKSIRFIFTIAALSIISVCAGTSRSRAAESQESKYAAMVLSSDHKSFDIRARAKLSTTAFRVLQGSCTDGSYGYYAFLNTQNNSCKIVKVALASINSAPSKAVVQVSGELPLGHSNDMCYNPTTKEIYVIHCTDSGGSNLKISAVSPSTLKKSRTFTIDIPASLEGATASQLSSIKGIGGIAYLPSEDQYVVMISGVYGNFLVLDSSFTPVRFIKCEKRSSYINQGIDCTADSIFVGRSCGSGSKYTNIIEEYAWDGSYKRQITLKGLTYELESIYHIGSTFYVSSHSYNELLTPPTAGLIYKLTDSAAVTGIKAGYSRLLIKAGSTALLKATVNPASASVRSINYLSNNNRVVSVSSSGTCQGLAPGDATILMYSCQGLYATTTQVSVVATPSITTISNQTSGILLQWPAQASTTKITIWRRSGKKAGAAFKQVGTVTGKNSFIDKKAKAGKFYTYKLIASNGSLTSGWSKTRSMWRLKTPHIIDTVSQKPSQLTSMTTALSAKNATNLSAPNMTITWKRAKGTTYYHIVYSKTSDFKKKKAVNVKGESTNQVLIDKGLKSGQTWYVKVYACHKGGKKVYSQPSAAAKIKIK